MDKRRILDEIKRLAAANGGRAPGRQRFERETGMRRSDWYPHLWLRWGAALEDAGFPPNTLQPRLPDKVVIEKYISLARELAHLPIEGELIRKSKDDPSFPSTRVFRRIGGKKELLKAVLEYCRVNSGFDDVALLCEESSQKVKPVSGRSAPPIPTGFVYLIKSGRHYKIGRTNSVGRWKWELGIKIPIPPKTIHIIETDDPSCVEAYWHKRFSEKRGEGEWFDLSPDDVAAFKRWKRIV